MSESHDASRQSVSKTLPMTRSPAYDTVSCRFKDGMEWLALAPHGCSMLVLMQVRAMATEAAQRASGIWRASAPAAAPSPEALPPRLATSPTAPPRPDGGSSHEGFLMSRPQSMQSPRAMAAPVTGSRSPARALPGASPLGGDPAPDSAPATVAGSPPRLRAIPATSPAVPAMRAAGTEGGGVLPADEAPTPVPAERAGSAPSRLTSPPSHAKGLPPSGRRVTRRSSHRTLRTLQVAHPCLCTRCQRLLALESINLHFAFWFVTDLGLWLSSKPYRTDQSLAI